MFSLSMSYVAVLRGPGFTLGINATDQTQVSHVKGYFIVPLYYLSGPAFLLFLFCFSTYYKLVSPTLPLEAEVLLQSSSGETGNKD